MSLEKSQDWAGELDAVRAFTERADSEWQEFSEAVDYAALKRAAQLIEAAWRTGGRLHFSGIGKPSYVAGYCASLFSSTGSPAYVLDGTEAVHGSSGQLCSGDVVVCISNSGETEELLRTAHAIRARGCAIIAVTGKAESALTRMADVTLLASVSHEGGPLDCAPRISILSELYVLMVLSVLLQARCGQTRDAYLLCHPGGALGQSLRRRLEGAGGS